MILVNSNAIFYPTQTCEGQRGEGDMNKEIRCSLETSKILCPLCRSMIVDVEPTHTLRGHTYVNEPVVTVCADWSAFHQCSPPSLLSTRQGVLSIAMSSTGDICFSGSLDSTICAWQLPSENVDPFDAYSKTFLSCPTIDAFPHELTVCFFFCSLPRSFIPISVLYYLFSPPPPPTHFQTLISTMQYLRDIQMRCGTSPSIPPASDFSPVLLMGLAASGTTSHPTPS